MEKVNFIWNLNNIIQQTMHFLLQSFMTNAVWVWSVPIHMADHLIKATFTTAFINFNAWSYKYGGQQFNKS